MLWDMGQYELWMLLTIGTMEHGSVLTVDAIDDGDNK